jgi:hypothetical protein
LKYNFDAAYVATDSSPIWQWTVGRHGGELKADVFANSTQMCRWAVGRCNGELHADVEMVYRQCGGGLRTDVVLSCMQTWRWSVARCSGGLQTVMASLMQMRKCTADSCSDGR